MAQTMRTKPREVPKFKELNRAIYDFCDTTSAEIFGAINIPGTLSPDAEASATNFVFYALMGVFNTAVYHEILDQAGLGGVQADSIHWDDRSHRADGMLCQSLQSRPIESVNLKSRTSVETRAVGPSVSLPPIARALRQAAVDIARWTVQAFHLHSRDESAIVPSDFIRDANRVLTLAYNWKWEVVKDIEGWAIESYMNGPGAKWDPATMSAYDVPQGGLPPASANIRVAIPVSIGFGATATFPDHGEAPQKEKEQVLLTWEGDESETTKYVLKYLSGKRDGLHVAVDRSGEWPEFDFSARA